MKTIKGVLLAHDTYQHMFMRGEPCGFFDYRIELDFPGVRTLTVRGEVRWPDGLDEDDIREIFEAHLEGAELEIEIRPRKE